MNTRIVKKFAFAASAALILGLAPAANARIALTDVAAQPHTPWDGKVDVSYTADGCRAAMLAEGLELTLRVTAVDPATHVTNLASAAALEGDATLSDGRHDLVWDLGKQGLALDPASVEFAVVCEAVPGVDYETLGNKPRINGVRLLAGQTAQDVGLPNWNDAFDAIYPVGAVYVSLDAALPELFTEGGREWERLEEGQFLMNTAGETGGTGGANSRALAVANLPSHTHTVKGNANDAGSHSHQQRGYWTIESNGDGKDRQCQSKDVIGGDPLTYGGEGVGNHKHYVNISTQASGSGAAFDNRPAYLAVSMWKRTK